MGISLGHSRSLVSQHLTHSDRSTPCITIQLAAVCRRAMKACILDVQISEQPFCVNGQTRAIDIRKDEISGSDPYPCDGSRVPLTSSSRSKNSTSVRQRSNLSGYKYGSVLAGNMSRASIGALTATGRPRYTIPGPRVFRPVIEDLRGTIRTKTKAVYKEVTFERQLVSVGRRVRPIYPAEFEPAPVPHQQSSGQTKARCGVKCYPVFVARHPRLDGSKEFIAAAEDQIVFLVWVNVCQVRP